VTPANPYLPNISGGELAKDTKLDDVVVRDLGLILNRSSNIPHPLNANILPNNSRIPTSGYSRFLVSKIMKLVNGEKRWKIMDKFEGSVVGMMRQNDGRKVLAGAFEVHAGEWERMVLFSDLFEKEVTLFGMFGSRDGREVSKAKAKRVERFT
jgi:hypothetical protein